MSEDQNTLQDGPLDPDDWYVTEVATFGDRLTAAREQAQLNQSDLARKLGVKKSTIANWEEDLSEPRANRLQMVSGILGVSLMWLLTGEGDEVEISQSAPVDQSLLTEIREIRTELLKSTNRLAILEKRLRRGAA